jgi:tetratricopeptide (TPR) repeat protein
VNRSAPNIYLEITARLTAARRKENNVALVNGMLYCGLLLLSITLVVVVFEGLMYFSVPVRTIVFWLTAAVAIVVGGYYVIMPLLRLAGVLSHETDQATAQKVGTKFPAIKDHLVNILQLYSERDTTQHYSPELIDASFDDVRKEIEPYDFTAIVDHSNTKQLGKLLGVVGGVGIMLAVFLPSMFFASLHRLISHNTSFDPPAPFRFVVHPGNTDVVKGETVRLTVRVEGAPQKEIILSTKPEGQLEYENHKLEPGVDGNFGYELSSLKFSTRYLVSSADIKSDEFLLRVIDRPIVKALRLQLSFPLYAKLAPRQLDDNSGDVLALKGTRISFAIESSKALASALLVFNDKTELPLNIAGSKATGNIAHLKDRTYHILLKDKDGNANAEPIEYTLKIIADAYPTAAIELPGRNVDIAENSSLTMLFRVRDDYGFSRLRLAHKLIMSRYEQPAAEYTFVQISLPEGSTTEALIPYLWNLSQLSLVPEDVISYYIEVFDNDNVSGPKSARSEVYTLRLPSLDEVFADLDKGHETSLETMKEALKDAEEAKKELDELQQQIKKSPQKMDWQDQKKAEEVAKKYQEIQKKIEEVNKTVEKMAEEMQKNQVLSKETLEKYQELQQMMEQMNSPEFAEAMKKMQQAMQQLNPEQMKQALQNFQFSEENFRKSIERTMNLLKRIQIEQKLDEAVKRTEQLMKQQEELAKKTEQTNPEDKQRLNDLAQQQKDLQKQLEQLQKELAGLQKKMEEFPTEMPLDEMDQARQQLERSQLEQQMEQIAQQMQQQQMQQAMQNQKQAMQKMGQFLQQMQQVQKSMQQNQQRQIVNEMRRSLQDLLELSKRQEELKNESQRLEQNSQAFRENAAKQVEIMRDLTNVANDMSKLSQKTFSISPEMGKSIGDAMREMNNAMQSLDQRNGQMAGQQQGSAMGSLNEAASQMQGAMNAMMQGQGGQGMGMAGLMQRLEQMSGQQQGINKGTQGLGMTQQQAAEMSRLAGEQGMVRKSLEQLAKEAAQSGDLSKMLGDLSKIAQEMREVQTDLAQGNINPETLRKQERILSRLLDSQRSARERDFEKKRKAETGREIVRKNPGAVDLSTRQGKIRLRQDMLKALEEGYTKDYEEVIKKYFELLEQDQREN